MTCARGEAIARRPRERSEPRLWPRARLSFASVGVAVVRRRTPCDITDVGDDDDDAFDVVILAKGMMNDIRGMTSWVVISMRRDDER